MRRLIAPVAVLVLAGAWAGSPAVGKAACASTATLEQSAQVPGTAIFTGRATRVMPESGDVVFAVDRWFHGPGAARVVRLLAPYAYVVEPPTAGVITVTLARTTSGEAISLVRDQAVLMIAALDPESGGFATQACSIAGGPLDSDEGRAALAAAGPLFGPGIPAVELPATDARGPGLANGTGASGGASDVRPLILVLSFVVGLGLARRRIAG